MTEQPPRKPHTTTEDEILELVRETLAQLNKLGDRLESFARVHEKSDSK